jgi:hypothetical protein
MMAGHVKFEVFVHAVQESAFYLQSDSIEQCDFPIDVLYQHLDLCVANITNCNSDLAWTILWAGLLLLVL